MPFTVARSRTEMLDAMGTSRMLTEAQRTSLVDSLTNVIEAVKAIPKPITWSAYWNDLAIRIAGLDGNISVPTAQNGFGPEQPPELPPKYTAGSNKGLVILLNDCFDNTLVWMPQNRFSPE